ncbi:MAG: hypothetical protein C0490_22620, partial [Marivirga sp.]|nr:hypothetical protein [Marivirga sp.]
KAIQIVNGIAKHFDIKIKLVDFFEYPTIQRQSKFIEVDQWLNEENDSAVRVAKTENIV